MEILQVFTLHKSRERDELISVCFLLHPSASDSPLFSAFMTALKSASIFAIKTKDDREHVTLNVSDIKEDFSILKNQQEQTVIIIILMLNSLLPRINIYCTNSTHLSKV